MSDEQTGGPLPPAQPTERQALHRELDKTVDERRRSAAWLLLLGAGPVAIVAVVLALVFGEVAGAGALLALGLGVELARQWGLRRRVKRIERELEDPMDGS